MNVVILDAEVAYPATSISKQRTLHLMLHLASRHHLTYFARCCADADQNREAATFLQEHGIEPRLVEATLPCFLGLHRSIRSITGLFSSLPFSVASHYSEQYRFAVAHHARLNSVDLFQLEHPAYLYAIPSFSIPTILQLHQLETPVWTDYCKQEASPMKRWLLEWYRQKVVRFERELLRTSKQVVTVSVEDAALLREWFGVDHLHVIDDGIEVADYRTLQPNRHGQAILMLAPEQGPGKNQGFELMLEAIFPAIRALLPEATLRILGKQGAAGVRARSVAQAGVEWCSEPADLRSWLETSSVLAIPVWEGAGARQSILQALAAGVPVVTTSAGADRVALRPGLDFSLANTPEEFTRALIQCLKYPEKAQRQAEHGQQTVFQRYDWSNLAERLERVWEKTLTS